MWIQQNGAKPTCWIHVIHVDLSSPFFSLPQHKILRWVKLESPPPGERERKLREQSQWRKWTWVWVWGGWSWVRKVWRYQHKDSVAPVCLYVGSPMMRWLISFITPSTLASLSLIPPICTAPLSAKFSWARYSNWSSNHPFFPINLSAEMKNFCIVCEHWWVL